MTDEFILTIDYKGERKNFDAKLLLQGYMHRFKVLVNESEIFFEPDEEGCYRAIKMPWQDEKQLEKIDKDLLRKIQQQIEAILR